MPRNELGGVRRSQVVSTHGPGAIIDFRPPSGGSVSGVAAGQDEWDRWSKKTGLSHGQVTYEPRLERELGVRGFRLPPVAPQQRPGVPVKNADYLVAARFPNWLQCPQCHTLKRAGQWDEKDGDPGLRCQRCTDSLGSHRPVFVVPARFIRACELGHLDEFPWDLWVGHREDCKRRQGLVLQSRGGAGLAALKLKCQECGAERSMDGCFGSPEIERLKCAGHRPWLGDHEPDCHAKVHVLQRGASNIYFAVTLSSIDIPPWSDPLQAKLQEGHHWQELLRLAPEKRPMLLELQDIPARLGVEAEVILERVTRFEARQLSTSDERLRWEEYEQLRKPYTPFGATDQFETKQQALEPRIAAFFSRLVAVTRLREVRAFTGFTRISPPAGRNDPRIAKIRLGPKPDWLPAIEVRGEGVFLELDLDVIAAWEKAHPEVVKRAGALDARHEERWLERKGAPDERRKVTPRFLLVHSLAHALIEQLALTCGYASASLRERLYVGDAPNDMAALLIYTASPDADGTLGGLSRQARSEDFAATVTRAIKAAEWCSSDPLCIEERMSASHGMNGAACHACLLSAETSCEEFNYLLDRAMLVGTPENRSMGFFAKLLQAVDDDGL